MRIKRDSACKAISPVPHTEWMPCKYQLLLRPPKGMTAGIANDGGLLTTEMYSQPSVEGGEEATC